MDEQPTGTVCVVDACASRESPHAVYAVILCTDEAGKAWHFRASCFNFELKPGHPIVIESPAPNMEKASK